MESRNFKMLIVTAVFFSLWTIPAIAHEGPHDEAAEAEELQKSGNASDIWQEIKEHEMHLQMLIQNGQLDQVHEAAFTIRDLSKSLAEKTAGLSPVNVDKVKSSVDEISKVADLLDEAGDAGDKAKTQEHFAHLQLLLETIGQQYPNGVLPKDNMKEEESDMKGMKM